MKKVGFQEALTIILREDSRYDENAYYFLRDAIDFTIKLFSKPAGGRVRHVTGAELLEGIRQFALQEFGPLAKTVLNRWGVRRCEDWGEIVFHLVEKCVLGKTDQDKREDFSGGYDFDEAFLKPYLPASRIHSNRSTPPRNSPHKSKAEND